MAADILLATSRPDVWNACLSVFGDRGSVVRRAVAMADCLAVVRSTAPRLVVLDLDLDPTALRRAVIDVLMINAAVHTAAVTNLEEEAFHDAMEGLGMLMSLPTSPGPHDVERLLDALEALELPNSPSA